MRTLILGGTGYLGRHLTRHLVQSGHPVTSFIRRENAAETVRGLGAQPVLGSLTEPDTLAPSIAEAEAVIFAAQLMLDEERHAVVALLERMEGTGKTFIFTSGTSILSRATDGDWDENSFGEDDPFEPRRQIAPRLEVEQMVRAAAERGVRAMCVRPSLVWGHGGSQILREFYHSARSQGAVCYVGRGLNVYSSVHVDDLAEIYRLMIERGSPGALYHAVSGETGFGAIAREIARLLGVGIRSVTVEEGCEIWDRFMSRIVLSSCSRSRAPRTRTELGWVPSSDRLDICSDLSHRNYIEAGDRVAPSWVGTASAS